MDARQLTAEHYHLTLVLLPLPTPSFSLTYTSLLVPPPPPFTARKAPASCTPPHTSPLSTPLQNRAWESENRRETSSQDRQNHISSPVEKRDFSQPWFGCLGDRPRLQGLAHCHTRETHALPHSYTPTPSLWPLSKKVSGMGSKGAQVLNTDSLQPSQNQTRADLVARPSRLAPSPQKTLTAKVGLHIPRSLSASSVLQDRPSPAPPHLSKESQRKRARPTAAPTKAGLTQTGALGASAPASAKGVFYLVPPGERAVGQARAGVLWGDPDSFQLG